MVEPPEMHGQQGIPSLARVYAVAALAITALVTLVAGGLVYVWRRQSQAVALPPLSPVPVAPLPVVPAAPAVVPAKSSSVPPVAVSSRRAILAAALTALACVLMLVSTALFADLRFRPWNEFFDALAPPVVVLVAGILLLGAALWQSPWRIPFIQPILEFQLAGVAWLPLGVGVVLLAVGTVFGGRLIESLPFASAHVQFLLLLAGVLVTGWALSGAPRGWPAIARNEGWLVLGLTLLALVLRLVAVKDTVPGFLDELHTIHGIRALWDDPAAPLLRQVSTFLPATILFNYWNVLTIDALGHSLESLRLVSAWFGALTVAAVYLLARAAVDRKTALTAALLLVAFPPHMFYSRIAHSHIADAFFGVLALGLLVLGLRTGRRWAWAWGGIALGMTQYFFEGSRLLFPPLVLVWFVFLFVAWGPRRMRPHLRGMATALAAALLVALPMYVTMAATGAPFSSRLNDSGAGAGLIEQMQTDYSGDPFMQNVLLRRFVNPFLAYTALPDSSGNWYSTDQPMVLPILAPLLLLGAGFSLWRLRSPASIVLLAILATSAGNILVQETLWYARYVMAMPLLPVLMAIGLRSTVPMLWPRARWPESPGWRRAGAAVVPGVAALAMVGQAAYFFGPFQQAYAISWRASDSRPDSNDAVLRAADLPDIARMQVYLIEPDTPEEHVPRGLLGYLVPDAQYPLAVAASADLTPEYLAQLPRDRGYVFFVQATDMETMRRLAEAFPIGAPRYSTRPLLPVQDQLLMFVVPPPGAPAP